MKERKNRIWKFLAALLIFGLIIASLPQPAQAAGYYICDSTHTVKKGEKLARIAGMYNISLYRLARANELTYPYQIDPGDKLCIPGGLKPSSNFTWTATYTNNKITLSGASFKKFHPIIVKVRLDDNSAFIKLGKTKSNKNGQLQVEFNTPKAMQNHPSIMVCVKDGVTDYLGCRQVWRR